MIFDPEAALAPAEGRFALQLYQRSPEGRFLRCYKGPGPVHLATLDVWAVVRPDGSAPWLRLALDAEGQQLVPTEAERAEQERQRADEAEREIVRLRAELARRAG